MGRKKKKQIKPWCWYCNREFDDEKILIQHQKSKHFKCTFCHKKLYTGPGLSIHSMQVHKEKIDKIPFALPQRCNVDLEIYGMEGIPDEDIKEHERQKSGKEDEVDEKRIKMEYTQVLPPFPPQTVPVASGLPYMPPISMPLIPPPIQFGLAPPMFVARPSVAGLLPPTFRINQFGIPTMTALQQQQPTSSPDIQLSNDHNKISENNIPPPPPPPPSSVNTDVNVPQNIIPQTPTFPAYSGSADTTKVILKVAKPTSSTPNVKVILVHPEDDVPLEQIRLRLGKYSSFLSTINKSASNDLSWTKNTPLQTTSLNHNESNKLLPPPPPPMNSSYVYPQAVVNSPFDLPMPQRQWIAPNVIQFARPFNFGGNGGQGF